MVSSSLSKVVRSPRVLLLAMSAFSLVVLVRCVGDSATTPTPAGGSDAGPGSDAGGNTADGSMFETDSGGGPVDSGTAPKCDPTAPFTSVKVLQGFSSGDNEASPRLSPDELTLYYFSGAGLGVSKVYVATRAKRTDNFGAPTALPINDATHGNFDPTVSLDGLTIYWGVANFDGASGFGQDIWKATRASVGDPFSNPTRVSGILTVPAYPQDSGIFDSWPFLSADGSQLWFTSTRSRPSLANIFLAGNDIFVATKSGGEFSVVTAVTELNSDSGIPAIDGGRVGSGAAVISADALTIYVSSDRTGTKGYSDIWTSHRTTASSIWPAPTNVAELNTAQSDLPGWLSPDNCRLYFTSDRQMAGNGDLFLAERAPK
jgi:hypothetical protein